MIKTHTATKDPESGLWYCHMIGFPHIPVFGSFCEKKSDAMEYVKMYHGLPHKADEVEKKKKGENDDGKRNGWCKIPQEKN